MLLLMILNIWSAGIVYKNTIHGRCLRPFRAWECSLKLKLLDGEMQKWKPPLRHVRQIMCFDIHGLPGQDRQLYWSILARGIGWHSAWRLEDSIKGGNHWRCPQKIG